MSRRIVPVSTLVRYIRQHMEADPVLHGVMIEGEISNFRRPSSGHWYFSLKDDYSSIPVVMFAQSNRRLSFQPHQGDKAVVIGDVTVYEAEGRMQMIASNMQPSGIGDLYLRLEALKKKLNQEGLFREDHKKRIPGFASDIALVTGNNTAAREDVLITLKRRWPICRITEYPCPVQGMDSVPRIIDSLKRADAGNHQIILLVRGGGSLEELWCFNDENLARCIYSLNTPVITGIGHEIDTTIADYVSDLRANTPTGAAEAAVCDRVEVHAQLMHMQARMERAVRSRDEACRLQWKRSKESSVFRNPERICMQSAMKLDVLSSRLDRFSSIPAEKRHELSMLRQRFASGVRRMISGLNEKNTSLETRLLMSSRDAVNKEKTRLVQNASMLEASVRKKNESARIHLEHEMRLLDAYSPLKVMDRGYSIVFKDNHVVTSVDTIEKGDTITVRMSDGSFTAAADGGKEHYDR